MKLFFSTVHRVDTSGKRKCCTSDYIRSAEPCAATAAGALMETKLRAESPSPTRWKTTNRKYLLYGVKNQGTDISPAENTEPFIGSLNSRERGGAEKGREKRLILFQPERLNGISNILLTKAWLCPVRLAAAFSKNIEKLL